MARVPLRQFVRKHEQSVISRCLRNRSARSAFAACNVYVSRRYPMGRGILLWLLGVPIPIIILLALFFR